MSFIKEDKELMTILMGLGAADIMKSAQTQVATSPADYNSVAYRIAVPLLVNLQREIRAPGAPPKEVPLGTETANAQPQDLAATVTNLRTLGDFIQWAADKKLTWNGKRFAWKAEEKSIVPENAWSFTSYKQDRTQRVAESRQPQTVSAYALEPELAEYLAYLRDVPAKDNKVLQVMLGKIIGELNVYLEDKGGQTIETKRKKDVAEDPNQMVVVDGFASEVLDLNNWQDYLNAFQIGRAHV
jgi:hypothetical protein